MALSSLKVAMTVTSWVASRMPGGLWATIMGLSPSAQYVSQALKLELPAWSVPRKR